MSSKDITGSLNMRAKTIRQLIKELQTFENQDLEVRISVDDGDNKYPISIVTKSQGMCVLVYSSDGP